MDDVYTTGATATECAEVLRRAGASKVWVATVARTQKLASNYEQFRPDTDEEDTAGIRPDEEQEQTVAHAAGS